MNDKDYKSAESGFRGGGFTGSESTIRDVPATQFFQNLEMLIGKLLKPNLSFRERMEAETAVACYEEGLGILAKANGIALPTLNQVDPRDLQRLDIYHNRQELVGSVADARIMLDGMDQGIQYLKTLYGALHQLLVTNPMIPEQLRDEAMRTVKPAVYAEFLGKARGGGNAHSTQHLLEEPRRIENAVKLWTGNSGTALVKVTDEAVEQYARGYYTVEVVMGMLFFRIKQQTGILQGLEADLVQRGGPLTLPERQDLETFAAGTNLRYNMGRHLINLDFVRYLAEIRLRQAKYGNKP